MRWHGDCLAHHTQNHTARRLPAPLQVLARVVADVQEYLGHAAVYVGMETVWYSTLYKHTVRGNTARDVGVISQLDDVMGSIMCKATLGVAEGSAAAVARAAFAALRTTLLTAACSATLCLTMRS